MTGRLRTLILSGALCAFGAASVAQNPDNPKPPSREHGKPTADDAKGTPKDRQLMQSIRKALRSDKSLSTSAKNVKVISQNGKVTLRGVVKTEEERQSIEAKAVQVAGEGNVVNDLSVGDSTDRKSKKEY